MEQSVDQKELMKWAMYGISMKIDVLEEEIRRGKRILNDRERGWPKDYSPFTDNEIKARIKEHENEIEELCTKKNSIQWDRMLLAEKELEN